MSAEDPNAVSLVGCGYPVSWARVAIASEDEDGALQLLPEGQLGEICVSSPSVAAGYWAKLELSEQTFRAQLNGRAYLQTGMTVV